jgi:hypothetical protein
MVVDNRKAKADLNPTSVALWLRLWVGMLLVRWRFSIQLAPCGMAQRENHNRNVRHRKQAATCNHPDEEEETEKDKTDDKTLRRLLNQMIQKLGHTCAIKHRVFHTIL